MKSKGTSSTVVDNQARTWGPVVRPDAVGVIRSPLLAEQAPAPAQAQAPPLCSAATHVYLQKINCGGHAFAAFFDNTFAAPQYRCEPEARSKDTLTRHHSVCSCFRARLPVLSIARPRYLTTHAAACQTVHNSTSPMVTCSKPCNVCVCGGGDLSR